MNKSDAYRDAGVDLDAAETAQKKVARLARSTFNENVGTDIGTFGGIYKFPAEFGNLLVASTDGVGTKIKVAAAAGIYNTVGRDLVNHCVNDILTLGAKPLFFLDYIGHSDLDPERIASIVEGLSIACRENGLALIGGETAQMPGTYKPGDFDLVGTIVGSIFEDKVIDGSRIEPGNKLIALVSNGLQTNGYSLARKALIDSGKYRLDDTPNKLGGLSVGEALLAIHPSYLKPIELIRSIDAVTGMAHITGGGIPGNLIRILPSGCAAKIDVTNIIMPPIFKLILGEVDASIEEMYHVFNMGAGYIVSISEDLISSVLSKLAEHSIGACLCGEIIKGERSVILEGIA